MTGRQIFAIDREATARFRVGQDVHDHDRHGEAVERCVIDVKPGNKVALVIVETIGES